MRLRALGCALAGAAALLAAGCGGAGSGSSTGTDALTVYSSLPLEGPGAARSRDVIAGEKLALAERHGAVGPYTISFRSLDDAAPGTGWQPAATVTAARQAAADTGTIAYLGDFEAAATALSLPTTNAAGILQISPASSYAGFVGGESTTPGEPEKYEPSGHPTFGRIAPSDAEQADAIARIMGDGGCRRIALLHAPSAFDASLTRLVGEAAQRRSMRVVLDDHVRPDPGAHRKAAQEVADSGAQCATFSGDVADDPAGLLRAVHASAPRVALVTPMALADDDVARALGPAGPVTTMLGPAPPDRRFAAAFRSELGRAPGPWAEYGYAAMRRALQAIARAGGKGNDRRAVIGAYFRLPPAREPVAAWRPTPRGMGSGHVLPTR